MSCLGRQTDTRCLQRLLSSPPVNAASGDHYQQTLGDPWLLHSSSVELTTATACLFTSRPSTSEGPERCCPSGRQCSQIRTHHDGPSRRASLAASATANTVQNSNLCSVWLCPWARSCLLQQRLHPSRRHFWSGKSSFGRTPRHACLSLRQEHSSANGVSMLQLQPSETRFHHIHYPRGLFRAGLKTISSYRPTDTSKNFCWRVYYFTLHYITWCKSFLLDTTEYYNRVFSTQPSIFSTQPSIPSIFSTQPSIFSIQPSILYTTEYILYTAEYILYTAEYILYTTEYTEYILYITEYSLYNRVFSTQPSILYTTEYNTAEYSLYNRVYSLDNRVFSIQPSILYTTEYSLHNRVFWPILYLLLPVFTLLIVPTEWIYSTHTGKRNTHRW